MQPTHESGRLVSHCLDQAVPGSGSHQRARFDSVAAAAGAAGAGVAAGRPRGELPLNCPPLETIRECDMPFVDKTAAIVDMLNFSNPLRALFTRPRKFGKSLTLEMAARILAAGSLPPGVDPSKIKDSWRGYAPVDIEKLFGGLAVYDELKAPLAAPYDQLNVVHFVILPELGAVSTGADLKQRIIGLLALIAGEHFGEAAEDKIRSFTLLREYSYWTCPQGFDRDGTCRSTCCCAD